jgi:hypothetical protein
MEQGETGEINKKESIKNPYELMDRFYSSKIYELGKEKYFKDKTLSSDVTEKEKDRVFLDSQDGKNSFMDFNEYEVKFSYNPQTFPDRCADAIKTYIDHVAYTIKKEKEGFRDNEEVEALDSLRWDYHNAASRSLIEAGIAPSLKIGRAIARLVAIEKALDNFDNARRPDIDAIKSKLGVG